MTISISKCGILELLILQSTPFCNLASSYCYLSDKDSKLRMTKTTIKRTLERVLESGLIEKEFRVLWHAGEPLVVGTEYYREAFKLFD